MQLVIPDAIFDVILGAAHVVVAENAAEERRPAQQRKEIVADLRRDQHFGVGVGAERAAHRVEPGDAVEGRRAAPPVGDVAAGRPGPLDAGLRIGVEDPHELLGVGIRQRLQHDAVHEREEQRRGADADTHGGRRQQREAGRAPQHPGGIRQLAAELFGAVTGAGFRDQLASAVDGAHLEAHLPARLGVGHAGLHLRRDGQFHMERQLLVGFARDAPPSEHLHDPPPQAGHGITRRRRGARASSPPRCAPRPSGR